MKTTKPQGNHMEKQEAAAAPAEQETITSYKGFDSNWQCRGFQYALGQTVVHDGDVEACASGFHACEYPLDVFSYYEPSTSKFAVVEQSGQLSRHSDDTKVASKTLTVKAEINLPGLIKAAIEYTVKRCAPIDKASPAYSESERGAASSTGYGGAASSTGYGGAASSTGKHAVAMACGYEGRAMAGETGAIVLAHRNDDGVLVHIRASKVGENGIKAGAWYQLNVDGQFVECAA